MTENMHIKVIKVLKKLDELDTAGLTKVRKYLMQERKKTRNKVRIEYLAVLIKNIDCKLRLRKSKNKIMVKALSQ